MAADDVITSHHIRHPQLTHSSSHRSAGIWMKYQRTHQLRATMRQPTVTNRPDNRLSQWTHDGPHCETAINRNTYIRRFMLYHFDFDITVKTAAIT